MSNKLKAIFTCVVLIAAVIWLCDRLRAIADITSPNSTYRVALSGENWRPEWGVAEVWMRAYKGRKLLVANRVVYRADYLDPPFGECYPMRFWDSERVLRLTQGQPQDWPSVSLLVANQTERHIRLLDIYAGDKLLLFDIEPREERQLFVPYNDMTMNVICQGEFADGSEIRKSGASFPDNGSSPPQLSLKVLIQPGSVTIVGVPLSNPGAESDGATDTKRNTN